MSSENKKTKWTKKFRAVIISLGLALAVAIGGAFALLGASLSNNGEKLGVGLGEPVVAQAANVNNASTWNTAMAGTGAISITLTGNWTATAGTAATNYVSSFGTGTYFKDGALYIPSGKTVTLNLGTYTLNRNQTAIDAINGCVIYNEGTLTISGTGTITGGWNTNDGGGIYNAGTLTISSAIKVIKNKALRDGGGIYSAADSTLTVSNGTFGGSAANKNTSGRYGGAIGGSNCTVTISGGTFSYNEANNVGGAVYIASNKKLTISGGTYSYNTALTSHGGAMYLNVNGASSTLSGGTFSNNSATASGGAIYLGASSQKLTISGGTFTNNTAVNAGGAICLYRGNVDITGTSAKKITMTGNTARYGGGLYFESNATTHTLNTTYLEVKDNINYEASDAVCGGAGVYLKNGTANLKTGTVISGNHTDAKMTNVGDYGGGLYINATITTLDGVTMEENHTVYIGGAVYSNALTLNVKNSTFKYNYASQYGGGIYTKNTTAGSTFTVETSTFDHNGIDKTTGTTKVINGGAIYAYNQTNTIKSGTFNQNSSNGSGAVLACGGGTTYKNIIGTSGGKDTDINCTYNFANGGGGGVAAFWGTTATVYCGTYTGNSGTSGGGAWYSSDDGVLTVHGGIYTNNGVINTDKGVTKISSLGGVIYGNVDTAQDQYSKVTVNGGTYTGNNGTNGGVFHTRGALTVNGGTYKNNTATYGAFAYAYGTSAVVNTHLTITGGTIESNTAAGNATNGGGAVYAIAYTKLTITGGSIKNNTTTLTTANLEKSAGVVALGSLEMSGTPQISGNKRGTTAANLYSASAINITGAITAASFKVATLNKGVITSGFNSKGKLSAVGTCFTSDLGTGYSVAYSGGEIIVTQGAASGTLLITPSINTAALTYTGARQTIVSGYNSSTMTISSVTLQRFTTTAQATLGTATTTLSNTTNALGYSISGTDIQVTEAGKYTIVLAAKTSGAKWVAKDGTTTTANQTLTVTVNKVYDNYVVNELTYDYNGNSRKATVENAFPSNTTAGFENIMGATRTFTYYKGGNAAANVVASPDATYLNHVGLYYVQMTPTYVSDAVAYNHFVPSSTRKINIRTIAVAGITATVTTAESALVYDGTAKKPAFTLAYNGVTMYTWNGTKSTTNNATTNGSLTYTVTYTDNTEPGTGTISINITAATNFTPGTKTVTFTIKKISVASGTITGTPTYTASKVYDGTDTVLNVKVNNLKINISGITISGIVGLYNNANVGTGKTITFKLILTGTGADHYDASFTKTDGAITQKNIATDITVGTITAPTYNGKAQTPTPTVSNTAKNSTQSSTTLTKDTDYTLAYKNNTDAGTATITISGKGNYNGSKEVTFTINRQAVKDPVAVTGLTYNNANQTLISNHNTSTMTWTVKAPGATAATASTAVTGKTAGTYEYVFTPGKNYQWTTATNKTAALTVKPAIAKAKVNSLTWGTITKTYDGTALNASVSAYTTTTTVNSAPTVANLFTIAGSQTAVGTKKATATLKDTTNYEFNSTVTNSTRDSASVASTTLTINAKSISGATVTLTGNTGLTYNGASQKAGATVTIVLITGNTATTLVKDTDFTLSYANGTDTNAVNAGTVTVTVTGKGNYSGTATSKPTYSIAKKNIATDGSIAAVADVVYKGAAHTPEPAVTNSAKNATQASTTLTKTTDFTYAYSNNINKGEATITVTGAGNYTGTMTKKFNITAKNIATDGAVAAIADVVYKGAAHTPTPAVTNSAKNATQASTTLTKGTDYTLSYSNNINKGEGTVTVTGTGNYTGTLTKTFNITAKNIATDGSVANVADVTYTGLAQTPEPAVTNSAKNADQTSTTLTKGTDFTYSYANNINNGTATITVTGKGNYSGTMTKTFTINRATIISTDITFKTSTIPYVGQKYSVVELGGSTAVIDLTNSGTKTEVAGTYAWKTPETKITNTGDFPDTRTITATAVFTPTDTSIAPFEMSVSFTAKQLKVTVTEHLINESTNSAKIAVDYGTAFTYVNIDNGDATVSTAFTYTINGSVVTRKVYFTGENGYSAIVGVTYDEVNKTVIAATVDKASVTANYDVHVSYNAEDVNYTVFHVRESVNGYPEVSAIVVGALVEKETRQGKTSSTVNPQRLPLKSYTGFAIDTTKTVTGVKIDGDGSTVVYIYYARNTYAVSFSATGATNVEKARTVKHGTKIAEPEKVPKKTAYDFDHWSLTKNGEAFDFDNYEVTGPVTLYAVFKATEYKVYFDFNAGEGEDQIPFDEIFKIVQIDGNIMAGYIDWDVDSLFRGFNWNETDGGEGTVYEITYSLDNMTSNKRITSVKPYAVGYTFVGWYDGTSTSATEVIRVPNSKTQDITLTAKWKRTDYTIRFDYQNNTRVKSDEFTNLTEWTNILPADVPEKTGSSFVGWSVNSEYCDDVYDFSRNWYYDEDTDEDLALFCIADFVESELTDAGNGYTVTLYAIWEPKPVTVKITDNEKGTISLVKDNATLGDNATVYVGDVLTVNVKENPGYKYNNLVFNTPENAEYRMRDFVTTFTVTTSLVNSEVKNGETTYFISLDAEYTERRFTIKYELDGGHSDDSTFAKSFSPSELLATSSKRAILPSKLTKNGYDFDGWIYAGTENGAEIVYANDQLATGEYYGKTLYLKKPASIELDNITLVATWKAQPATVYLYNATYKGIGYEKEDSYYYIDHYELNNNVVPTVTGSKIMIESPERDSFKFLGWATTRNGTVVYPATQYDDNDKAASIPYTVNADHDTAGNKLNRNNLYAVWHVKDVDYIIMSAANNNCTYGTGGIKLTAVPSHDYSNSGSEITLTYRWYRVFAGMYDSCFTVKDYVDKNGYKWYVDENGDITAYEKDGKYYNADKSEEITQAVAEAYGTKLTIKDFNKASVDVGCKEMFTKTVAPGVVPEVTVQNVANCGTYICVVDVVASDGGSESRAEGYGEIEISMSKATYGNLKLESQETEYDTTAQWGSVVLDFVKADANSTLPHKASDGLLKLPDGSKLVATYTYYKGAGELVNGEEREEITDLSQIKNVGAYHVVVSFEWATDGDKGNYEELDELEADLYIRPMTINSVTPKFVKDGEIVEGEFAGTYDGSSYGVDFIINDKVKVDGVSTKVTDIDDVAIDVKVFRMTENGDVAIPAAQLPTTESGSYAVVMQENLKGEAADNYILGGAVARRKEYTIGQAKFDVADHIHFDDAEYVYDGQLKTISIGFDDGYELPDSIEAKYTREYYAEDTDGTTKNKTDNGGVDAGIYVITVKFEFKDTEEGRAAANNYEKLADMTATLTIKKADFLEFHNVDNKDILRDGGFVSASYGFILNTQYHPYLDVAKIDAEFPDFNSTELSVTYTYYQVIGETRTCLTYDSNDNPEMTHEALVEAGKTTPFISKAGKYEIVAHIEYKSWNLSNNYEELEESQTTITYEIESKGVEKVEVIWADGFDKKVKLGEAFDYEWIKQINVTYEDGAGTLEVTAPADIDLAVIAYGKKGGVEQSNFWHVGAFDTLTISYYGKASEGYAFTVYEDVNPSNATIKYRVGEEGEYANVPEGGLPLLSEGAYSFEISYAATNEAGNRADIVKYATVKGTAALGDNLLNVTDAGYYVFGEIKVALYEVLEGVTWEYSLDGTKWVAMPENGELPYAGAVYGVRAVKDGMTFEAHTSDDSDVLIVNSYVMVVGRSGNYRIDEDYTLVIKSKVLNFTWDSDEFEYNRTTQVPTITESGVEEIDAEDVKFIHQYTDVNGNDILTPDNIVSVGTYNVTVSLDPRAAAARNYTVEGAENVHFTFRIVKADIRVEEVYYSESNYGKNVSYAGNEELRLKALNIDFGENPSVVGTFKFIKVVDGQNEEISGAEYKDALKKNGTIFVKCLYEPENKNYNDLVSTITIDVKLANKKTGEGALVIEKGPDAIEFYLLEDKIDTHDLYVYQLYDSAYQENGKWYGARELVTAPVYRIEGHSGTIDSYRVNAQDVSGGKIVLIALLPGAGSSTNGKLDLLVIDKAPTGIEIMNAGNFRTKYYVGETPEFRDIEFRLLFGGDNKPAEGLKVPSIKSDFNRELTAEDGTFTVRFKYANVSVTYNFEALPKENLNVVLPASRILTWTGESIKVPELKFRLDVNVEDEIDELVEVGQNELEGVTVKAYKYLKGNSTQTEIIAEGVYTIRYEFTVTNPRFNKPDFVTIEVTVTRNPYRVTITVPEGKDLKETYTGKAISIPVPQVSPVVDTRDENAVVGEVVTYTISDGKNTPTVTESQSGAAWTKTNAGSYKVTVQVKVGEQEVDTKEYTFVIAQATNSSLSMTVNPVTLGEDADFEFPVAVEFGKSTVRYEYSQDNVNWSTTVPNVSGKWYVRATVAKTDNYTGATITKQFDVRDNKVDVKEESGALKGSIEGGDGIGKGWDFNITPIKDDEVKQVSINKQDVLAGYSVTFTDEGGTSITPDKAYTVRIKLTDELKGKTGLNVYYRDENGKLTKLNVVDSGDADSIAVRMNKFGGSVIITSAHPKESVALLASVIALGAVAGIGVVACVVVFLKKRKRGVN